MRQDWLSNVVRPAGTIVHIGAGNGGDLPDYLETGARAVLLVETRADDVAELERLAAERPEVTVVEATVSAEPGLRPFYQTNFPELDSFRRPHGLKELFPGLRVLSEEPTAPKDPAELVAGVDLAEGQSNLLVLETPGESLGILQSLGAAGLLNGFDLVRLREGKEPLYEGAARLDEISAYLSYAGFTVTLEANPEDPDRPHLLAQQDRARQELQRETEVLRQSLSEAIATLQERDEKIMHLNEAVTEAQQQAAERATQIENLTAARDSAAQEVETLRSQLTEAQQQAAERATQIKNLTAARDSAAQEAETLRSQLAGVQAAQEGRVAAARDEIIKAEGQIGLIRDLLLRGETL